MSEPPGKKATYDDLYGIPENATGEIIGGELVVTPKPSRRIEFDLSDLWIETLKS